LSSSSQIVGDSTAGAATIGPPEFSRLPPDGLQRPLEGSGRGGGADAHHDSRMARRRNRWRLECRAAARLVRAAHGQRVRQADDVPAVIVRALTSLAHEALALTASANAMDARASSSTSCRCAANADAMRPSTYSFHADAFARAASRSARRRASRASARFCGRFLCWSQPAIAEGGDDVIKLSLDRLLVEVLAEIRICLAHGGL